MSSAHDASAIDEPVGETLARMRKAKSMTGAQLGELVGMSQAKISRIERGKGGEADDIDRIARALGVDERTIPDLVERAGNPQNRMTDWRPVEAGLANMQREVATRESVAQSFRIFESSIINGLLQTSGYATAVLTNFQRLFTHDGSAMNEVAALEAVAGRFKRQEVLADPTKSFRFLMNEMTLGLRVCPPTEMLAQIVHLRKTAARENVSIKIVPDGQVWDLPPQHGFTIMDDRSVTIDLLNTALTSRGKLDVLHYGAVFDLFDELATDDIDPILSRYEDLYYDLSRPSR